MNGGNIRELRNKKGLSLDELAALSGISKSYISYIERGLQNNPSISILEKIAGALNVNIIELIELMNEPTKKEKSHL